MKLTLIVVSIFIVSISEVMLGQIHQDADKLNRQHSLLITALNTLDVSRPDEVVEVDVAKIKMRFPYFNDKAFVVRYENKEIPSQLFVEPIGCGRNEVEGAGKIVFVSSFSPQEKKEFQIDWKQDTVETHRYPPMTQAAIGIKVDYKKVNGYYTGGKFVDVDSTTIPADHFAHDALYRIEGPGWESDKIVYRFYLDSRNRNDIFGKKTHDLVLRKIGQNDLVSDSKESYTNMLDWGMDIFKVGESLGIGSIAMYHEGKAVTVSDADKITCRVFNGPILSGVSTEYVGWKVAGTAYNLLSDLSISPGSRLTHVCASVNGDSIQLCTGLAKHDGCDLITSDTTADEEWAYLALYGKQSLSGDNLGIAILYKKTDLVKLTEDSASEIFVLRPIDGRVNYYFGAAWEEEPNGIKNEQEFRKYLDETALSLSNPIQTYLDLKDK